jgi:hypothetical protein
MRTIASSGKAEKALYAWVGEDVPIGKEKDARTARRLTAQVPPAVEELPRNLESDKVLPVPVPSML